MNPDQIKKWLKETGKDRQWLAQKCGVSKSTVDGWMSNRPIPKPAISMILSLMQAEASFNPRLTLDQFAKIQQKAKSEGLTIEEWITKAIIGALCLALTGHFVRCPSDWSAAALASTGGAAWRFAASLVP